MAAACIGTGAIFQIADPEASVVGVRATGTASNFRPRLRTCGETRGKRALLPRRVHACALSAAREGPALRRAAATISVRRLRIAYWGGPCMNAAMISASHA